MEGIVDRETSRSADGPRSSMTDGPAAAMGRVEEAADALRNVAESAEAALRGAVDDIAGARKQADAVASDIVGASGRLMPAGGDQGQAVSVERLGEGLAGLGQSTRKMDSLARQVTGVLGSLRKAIDGAPAAPGGRGKAGRSVVRETLQPGLARTEAAIEQAVDIEEASDELVGQAARFGWLRRLGAWMGGRERTEPAVLRARIQAAVSAMTEQMTQSREVASQTIDAAEALDAYVAGLEQVVDSARELLDGRDMEASQVLLTGCVDLARTTALLEERLHAVGEDDGKWREAGRALRATGRQLMDVAQVLGRTEDGVRRHRGTVGGAAGDVGALRERITESRTPSGGAPGPTGQVAEIDGNRIGVVDLGVEISRDLRLRIERNILTYGEPFATGGVLGPAALPIVGAGAAVSSSLMAGNIFLATANPASLMSIGAGVGSAVMGPGGIVAQAPFIAASSAIIPVVAPVMFFMTVSSMMMSARFDRVEASLDQLTKAMEEVLKREIAGDFGVVGSANERLRDITDEFNESRRFTHEMKIRLALVERDLSAIHAKYGIISTGRITSSVAAELAAGDQHLYALAGIASIHVDRLRLKLALQDNPDDLPRSVLALESKIDAYEQGFRKLLDDNPLLAYQGELEGTVAAMSWWQRKVSKRKQRKTLEADADRALRIRADDLAPVLLDIRSWADSLDEEDAGMEQSVVYYRDQEGAGPLRAYYTSDVRVEVSDA